MRTITYYFGDENRSPTRNQYGLNLSKERTIRIRRATQGEKA